MNNNLIPLSNSLISVVIPTYNRNSLITNALESVYQQTYRPLEVIVVDDGSTDGTVETVQSWINTHPNSEQFSTCLVCQEKFGGNAARNRGIEASKGQFVAFLDSDDVWLPEKLHRQFVLFSDPDVGGVYCGLQHIDLELGKIMESDRRSFPVGWILAQMLVRDVTSPTSAFILRKDVFEKIGKFDLELQARQDWDMWIRLAAEYKIQAVPESLVLYGEHTGPRTLSDPLREIHSYDRIRKKYTRLLAQQPLRVRMAAKASYYKRKGRVYYHRRISTTKAIWFYSLALISNPGDFDTWAAIIGILIPTKQRQWLHCFWNRLFGNTMLAIRSH